MVVAIVAEERCPAGPSGSAGPVAGVAVAATVGSSAEELAGCLRAFCLLLVPAPSQLRRQHPPRAPSALRSASSPARLFEPSSLLFWPSCAALPSRRCQSRHSSHHRNRFPLSSSGPPPWACQSLAAWSCSVSWCMGRRRPVCRTANRCCSRIERYLRCRTHHTCCLMQELLDCSALRPCPQPGCQSMKCP